MHFVFVLRAAKGQILLIARRNNNYYDSVSSCIYKNRYVLPRFKNPLTRARAIIFEYAFKQKHKKMYESIFVSS